MNNGSVTPTASHFNQVRYSGKKHSGQSGPPILFAPLRAAHQHDSLGNTAQFPPCGLSTAPAAAARHLRCQNAR